MQNLIEQLGYDLAKSVLEAAERIYVGFDSVCVDSCFDGINRSSVSVNVALLRTQLAEYEAGIAPDSDYVKPNPVPAPIDQLTFDALNKILERTPDPTADFYVADTDTYFSTETGTYFNHAHQKWLESKYRSEQELRENYESVFNLLDVVEQVVALEPQAQTHTSSREAFERSQATEIKMDYSELKHRLDEHERILGYRYGERGQLFNQWTSWDKAWQHQQKRIDALKKQMVRAGFTDNGGYLLKPPLGKAPDFALKPEGSVQVAQCSREGEQ
jgi:hypothetical protein